MASIPALLIDGSVLEGGGQLLRNSVALAGLLSKPISIYNIRHNRKPPGLKYQHAAGLKLVAEICSADLVGCKNGSSAIDFRPGHIQTSRSYTADPKTAGSTTLLLQVSLPVLLYSSSPSPSELILRGGTNATQAPQIDYAANIFLPFLHRYLGLNPTLKIIKRGYFPKGGGEVHFSLPPIQGPLPPVILTERGSIKSISGRAYVAGLPRRLADEMCVSAINTLVSLGIDRNIINIDAVRERQEDVVGSGSGIVLWAETDTGCRLGGSAVGSKGEDFAELGKKAAEELGKKAAEELSRNLDDGGCVDEYLQDQIIIFIALAQGRSTIRTGPLTVHTQTAIWVAEQLSDAKFQVHQEDRTTVITCDGIGYSAAEMK